LVKSLKTQFRSYSNDFERENNRRDRLDRRGEKEIFLKELK
jgi:hypothetical protein